MQLPETPTEDEIILQAKRNNDGFYTVDNLREALECFYLNGFQDEVCGTVESGCHYYRVSRWIMQTDSQGFHEVFTYQLRKRLQLSLERFNSVLIRRMEQSSITAMFLKCANCVQ
jgi:hypothetical protein